MIPMVAIDMTPALVPFGFIAIVLAAAGLIAVIALIVCAERLSSRAIVEGDRHRPDMNPHRAMAKAVGMNHPAGATDWTVRILAKAERLPPTTIRPIDEARDVDIRRSAGR
jgi:hypothetical protein